MFTIKDEEEKKKIEKELLEKSNPLDSYILVNIADRRIKANDSKFLQSEVRGLKDPNFNKVEIWFTEALIINENYVEIQSFHMMPMLRHDFCEKCGQYKHSYEETFSVDEKGFFPYRCVCLHMKKIKAIQRFLKKRLLYKRLVSLIPEVTAIYYSPGCKGEFLAKHAFEKTASCT